MTCILAAAETVTSQGWWTQAVSIVITVAGAIGVLFGAAWSVYRFIPPVRRWWRTRKDQQRLERLAAFKAVVSEVALPLERRMAAAEHLGTRRHQQNLDELQEIGQRVGRVELSQRQINQRIDRHMDEEREERKTDRAELLGWLNMVGVLRREDVQELRDKRGSDDDS